VLDKLSSSSGRAEREIDPPDAVVPLRSDVVIPLGSNNNRIDANRTGALETMVYAGTGHNDAWAPPLPPSSASVGKSGLKDTPANRALSPPTTPQSVFAKPSLTRRAFYASADALLFNEDVSEALKLLADHGLKVDCIVTSPPFYGQRDYGIDGQIGLEQHPKEFIQKLLDVFELCRPVLRETGSMWVNLGDTYWSGKGAHKSHEIKQSARRFGMRPQDHPGDGAWTRPNLDYSPVAFAGFGGVVGTVESDLGGSGVRRWV
jgi:hypothetical protein